MPSRPETRAVRRAFTLADAMILTAATALGLGVGRFWLAMYREARVGPNYGGTLEHAIRCGFWVAIAWTLALIPLGFKPPRPTWRRLRSRPGFVAAMATAAALLVALVHEWFVLKIRPWSLALRIFLPAVSSPARYGPMVAVAWLTLAVARGWRSECCWIDRLGRALGAFWIGAYVVLLVAGYGV